MDDLDNLGANEIYLRRGTAPSAGTYDYRFSKPGADQQLFVPDIDAGTWYVLVVGAAVTGTGDYTLRADFLTGLLLQSISPTRIGNLITAGIAVNGAGFDKTAQAYLKLGASPIVSARVILWSRFFGSRLAVRSMDALARAVSMRKTACAESAACCAD